MSDITSQFQGCTAGKFPSSWGGEGVSPEGQAAFANSPAT